MKALVATRVRPFTTGTVAVALGTMLATKPTPLDKPLAEP